MSARALDPEGPRSADLLAAEVALISRARRALERSDHERAAAALAGHRARFPAGQLHAERLALELRLSCARGDRRDAQRLLGELAAIAPGSALLARAEQACPRVTTP